jgi:hypothetical protein
MTSRAPLLVTFLTGQSDPQRNALSPEQHAFLEALPIPPEARLPLNFPWRESAPHRDVPLWSASLANTRQYLSARRDGFSARHRRDLDALLARAEHVVFLAGSCGLELFLGMRPPEDVWPRLHVFAYGPVARARPPVDCLLVCGRRDPISRAFFPRADVEVDADHMGYLGAPDVREHARAFVTRVRAMGTCES